MFCWECEREKIKRGVWSFYRRYFVPDSELSTLKTLTYRSWSVMRRIGALKSRMETPEVVVTGSFSFTELTGVSLLVLVEENF